MLNNVIGEAVIILEISVENDTFPQYLSTLVLSFINSITYFFSPLPSP